MTEQWKAVKGWTGVYEVSDLGRVRRIKPYPKFGGYINAKVPRLLKATIDWHGYAIVELNDVPRVARKKVHIIVAEAFIGQRPNGLEINHKDRNRANNVVRNLEYVTHSQNVAHSYTFTERMKNVSRGMDHYNRKLTERDVKQIRKELSAGKRGIGTSLSKKYGISQSVISEIKHGRYWSHVPL